MHDRRSRNSTTRLRSACASALAVAFLLALVPSAGAASRPDPVQKAITTAVARKQVTPLKARQLRITWNQSARAVRNARAGSRRANIVAVRLYTLNLARAGALTGARLEPALLSVKATTHVMLRSTTYPSHEQELRIPGEVAIFTYYYGRGVQLQPFETFKQGLRELNQLSPDVPAARAIADRMLELDVPRGSSTAWEYYFPFGGPSRPWTSSISQAIATEFYHRVATLVPEAERATYDRAAHAAMLTFLRTPRMGGVGVRQGTGRFYVMYPFHPSQRILNGHLQVLLNLNRYATATDSPQARRVVTLGLRGVLPLMPRFDTGAWSNYQLGQEATLDYHRFQSEQLVKLGRETGHARLQEYGQRFTRYLKTPPVITYLSRSWVPIIPAPDGFRDRIVVRYSVDKRSRVTMVVRDQEGREVNRMSSWSGRGPGTIVWGGRDARGKVAADGNYVATTTTTDVAGNRSFDTLPTQLRIRRDRIAPSLRLLTLRDGPKRTSIVTVSAFDFGSAWVTAEVRLDGRLLSRRRGPRNGTTTLRPGRPLDHVRRGDLVLRDSSGNIVVYPLAS